MADTKIILITRVLNDHSALKKWSDQQGVKLLDISFIKTTPVKGLEIPVTDWIFFSSPSAVRCFFEEYELKQKHIAALGRATANTLSDLGYHADYIGSDEKEPSEIGKEFFEQRAEKESVFFPLSNLSQRNVVAHKGNINVWELVTYSTVPCHHVLSEKPDFIIFTSPSNVESYFTSNKLSASSVVIAIGKTTASALQKAGCYHVIISRSPREEDLIDVLQTP